LDSLKIHAFAFAGFSPNHSVAVALNLVSLFIMLFTKNAFFFLLLLIILLPFVLPNLLWIMSSQKTTGVVEGIGSSTGVSFGRDTYAYVSFTANSDTFYFQGMDNDYKQGDRVPLRYQKKNPEDARVATFYSLWGKTISYFGAPLIFWIICFFAPDIVPKGSSIRLGKKPFLKLVPPAKRRL